MHLLFPSVFYIFVAIVSRISLSLSLFLSVFLTTRVLLVHLDSISTRAGALGLQDAERIFSPLNVEDKSLEVSSRTFKEGSS